MAKSRASDSEMADESSASASSRNPTPDQQDDVPMDVWFPLRLKLLLLLSRDADSAVGR